VTGLLGDRGWAQDPVPDYSPATREVPPALGKLVRAFARSACVSQLSHLTMVVSWRGSASAW
jgi:hypothetical protein